MWSYYGSKSKIIHHYPTPKFDKIIEPFAGTARYALKYYDRDVVLIDKYESVIRVWKWLQKCSEKDVRTLPRLEKGQDIRNLNVSDEEKMFLGFSAGIANASPRNTVSSYAAEQHGRKNQFNRIADNLYRIRHWDIRLGSYQELKNEKATWFIDPPYQYGGATYVHSDIDYPSLAKWCKQRKGQAIVCENSKANWIDFKPMITLHGAMTDSTECIWSNLPTAFDHEQMDMFNSQSNC